MNCKQMVAQMTLEEKASLCSGSDFWHTKTVDRLDIPCVMVSDGPHGLRKQDLTNGNTDANKSIQAVCFPAACATACSFDKQLIYRLGELLGTECQAENVAVLLGPAVNIKRTPLCGRNFEYFSEDPYLTGELAAFYIEGVQKCGVGTSIKHFCANNQEERRMTVSADLDERTLREIYLTGFEKAVKQGKPWTVMCSYNRINGIYASENEKLLTKILREEWGFEGLVMSDWGAVNDRVQGIRAGLDLEMPSSAGVNDAEIVKAVKDGTLKEKVLDRTVERVLNLVSQYYSQKQASASVNWENHHQLAREIEDESIVLLKNETGILPLKENDKIAFIGRFAETPRYQGGGSSHINSFRVTGALKAVQGYANVSYAPGFRIDKDEDDLELLKEACTAAAQADVAVIFAGLPEYIESEGFDREDMSIPLCQNRLIEEVLKVQPNVVVILHNGSPVEMPWADRVKGILEAYLGGEAVGESVVDILYGKKNPCGKLAETVPVKLSDTPAFLFYPGEEDHAQYREGIFVGYRYYDKKDMRVLFPFGFGLSYTEFKYSNLKLSSTLIHDTDPLLVTVKVRNTGKVFGKEIVQLYIHDCRNRMIRPVKELKGFEKVGLIPGEEKIVGFQLDRRAFAYYDEKRHDWRVQSGEYEIMIGKSSRDIELRAIVTVFLPESPPEKFTLNSTLGELMSCAQARPFIEKMMQLSQPAGSEDELGAATIRLNEVMLRDMPLRSAVSFGNGMITRDMLLNMLDQLNSNL
ncbi:MAG TPA: glycoside hydrolase family 3 C-terminal domain-containing protein [Caproiciproducens sp.]|nr:glycoside hydrolase family 3 C-terminal domain-containing protein [Caproiciproducens sp.]